MRILSQNSQKVLLESRDHDFQNPRGRFGLYKDRSQSLRTTIFGFAMIELDYTYLNSIFKEYVPIIFS